MVKYKIYLKGESSAMYADGIDRNAGIVDLHCKYMCRAVAIDYVASGMATGMEYGEANGANLFVKVEDITGIYIEEDEK